ncbi:accessory Sec system glycosyltransferase GtfA [Aerococcus mictus]|uniref:UDP-N-acetylglucosamine--peptide N-acetylglucosaminyltransferase GtfA subunit n=1 Tax=Aerococcus tenax TaxID=3078812 RepID=A0A5N1BV05_9LACT|nr:accessory Sec system glycosyltransferase GtfA [Aerococcus urinae]KAA9291563.1 accessory Sec system glycosyltransferase GtfA [Aerococcus mictus]RAV65794.1 accessory Sec system glycosyltransferase GtfA [Aerococcus loyolae]KAA9242232.1 accessory Sec system glycosyltransferase GtfA [Aerococcus urinae]OFM50922.1 accessory Sec system glycosyltransferase GtfA [Aerococcus mictus]PKY84107.1 accessory Sec system glycosyltransferase GtfA [Aerococcus mictus]
MTIYNINKGIGWASSGVEYAQIYRYRIFKELSLGCKFIFTDLILNENMAHFTENIGFSNEDVIWMYLYFTDIPLCQTTVSLSQIKEKLSDDVEEEKLDNRRVKLIYDQGKQFAMCYLSREEEDFVDRVEYTANNKLIRKDFFNRYKFLTEYYAPNNNKAQLYMRRYFNQDGTTAYEEFINQGSSMYRFKDRVIYSTEELVAYFIEKLVLTDTDIVLLDRADGIAQGLLDHLNGAKLGSVVHAEHYNQSLSNDQNILWNNHYEYPFTHYEDFDFYITSTPSQTQRLMDQFDYYYGVHPKIYTIPVGSVDQLMEPDNNMNSYAMMTASRLAGEKNIDWLIEAVVKVHEQIPQVTFDIYGEGGKRNALQDQIGRFNAEDYIQLKGHQALENIYPQYSLYLTASTSEGFGLTLVEALSAGQAMIGLDVPYGNPTFIDDGKNGYLLPFKRGMERNVIVNSFAEAILSYFQSADRRAMREHSYSIAKQYLHDQVEGAWRQLVEEVKA